MWLALALMSVVHGMVSGQCVFNFPCSKNPEAWINIIGKHHGALKTLFFAFFFLQSETVSFWGYPTEEYDVVTEDGYILQLNRIPYGRGNVGSQGPRPVAFLQHGLFGEGSLWVTNLANNSLGFILADAGYDIWIGNSRGNTWSKQHLVLFPKQEEFWAFSFDEMAKYDLLAIIHCIEQKMGQKQLYYICHLQGTTIAFIAFSTMPQLAQMYFALAPVATVIFLKFHLKSSHSFLTMGLRNKSSESPWCPSEGQSLGCSVSMSQVKPIVKCTHFLSELSRCVRSTLPGRDFSTKCNPLVAGSGALRAHDRGACITVFAIDCFPCLQMGPPLHDVKDMKVPNTIWSGAVHCLADPRDVAFLLPQVRNLVHHKLDHLDFLLGLNATEVLYQKIVNMMKRHP
ncbi:hypothetical protein QYF61_015774 [Mycteria americana]|uniref:Lipase n=1 Tax=Mycteria americana TaxID=33587 RepID=A0AAN7S6K6_MYCAM|nr:hypothetical protein QYF61_015774 [Mycteria americana]